MTDKHLGNLDARNARPSPLPEDQALRVVQDLLDFTARNHRYLALRGMGSNVGLPLRLPLAEAFVPPQNHHSRTYSLAETEF